MSQEDVDQLPERVIDEDNTKTKDFEAIPVIILDGINKPDDDYTGAQVKVENPVFVLNDSGDTIGSAVVYTRGQIVMADLFLEYTSPERLDIETGRKFWLYPIGVSHGANTKGTRVLVHEIEIQGLSMLPEPPPLDTRILEVA